MDFRGEAGHDGDRVSARRSRSVQDVPVPMTAIAQPPDIERPRIVVVVSDDPLVGLAALRAFGRPCQFATTECLRYEHVGAHAASFSSVRYSLIRRRISQLGERKF